MKSLCNFLPQIRALGETQENKEAVCYEESQQAVHGSKETGTINQHGNFSQAGLYMASLQVDQIYAERDILTFADNPFVVSIFCTFQTKVRNDAQYRNSLI